MTTNFLELATTLEYLGAKWLLENKVNFTPCWVILYCESRDIADDEEAYDSTWDRDNNSEIGEESNKEEGSLWFVKSKSNCIRYKYVHWTANSVRVKSRLGQAFHWMKLLRSAISKGRYYTIL